MVMLYNQNSITAIVTVDTTATTNDNDNSSGNKKYDNNRDR